MAGPATQQPPVGQPVANQASLQAFQQGSGFNSGPPMQAPTLNLAPLLEALKAQLPGERFAPAATNTINNLTGKNGNPPNPR
jgi:hypothetical protein